MENTNFMRFDLDDVVFECRNRQYGAYLLRKGYGSNLKKASLWGSTAFLFMLISPLIKEKMQGDKPKFDVANVIIAPPPKTEVKKAIIPPPPPEPPKPEPKKIATTAFTPPKIKEDEKVTEPENIPKMDEITTAVANKTQDGEKGELPPVIEPPAPPIETPVIEEKKVANTNIYDIVSVQQVPEFQDGINALYKFLQNNIRYPDIARESNIQGTVYVGFVVWTDGSIRNISVKRGIGGGCNEEAMRVIQLMPNWKPGMQNGKPVPVSYTMPIKFKLE